MRKPSTAGAAVGLVAGLVVAGSALAFGGVANGSFEAGTYNSNPAFWQTMGPGDPRLTGWTIEAGSIDWIFGYWQPADGSKSIDMSGGSAGQISQTFATTVGDPYVVRFALSGNPDNPVLKTLVVSATGAPPTTYTYDNTGNTHASMNWVDRLYSFTATAASTKLTFTSATAGVFGPALDDVRVHQVAGSKDDCKKGGWQSLVDEWGNTFTNQGDCVSYVATGGRNPGAGGAP